MSQAGLLTVSTLPQIPTQFDADTGSAIPIGNVLEILAITVASGTTPIRTSGAGNTITIESQFSQAIAATDSTKVGLCNFDSSMFAVDANGFVTLAGGTTGVDSFSPNSGTDPVVADGTGLVNLIGAGNITTVGSLNTITAELTGLVNHSVQVGSATSTLTQIAVGTNGQILIGSTAADPVFGSVTSADASIAITEGAGTLDIGLSSNAFETAISGWNGSLLETASVTVASDGAIITLSVELSGGGDLVVVFSDGFYDWDTTPAATVALTAGADTAPTLNYVYFLQSTKTLTVSTVGWPATEYAAIAEVICESAATLQTKGSYKMHAWTDHVIAVNDIGHIAHINYWVRHQPATWESGVLQTYTITPNGGAADNVTINTSSGIVLQLHDHTFPAFAGGHDYYVINDFATPYTIVTDLNALLTDSTGASMSGRYFSLVLWGVVSESTGDCKLFINLPSGSYNSSSNVTSDPNKYANFSIPSDYAGTGFLISQWNLRHQAAASGTWTSIDEIDLRGLFPTIAAGGSTSGQTEFADNTFRIFDDGDSTKQIAFQASSITTATTRTITAANYDIDLATVAISAPTDSGTATPAAGALTFTGTNGITTSGAGSTVTIDGSSLTAATDYKLSFMFGGM